MLDVGCSIRLVFPPPADTLSPGKWLSNPNRSFTRRSCASRCGRSTCPSIRAAWQPKLQHWAGLIASGRADDFKETALLPDFLTDIFCGLLGYTGRAATADTYTLSRERHVEVDGKFADAVLGRFQKDKEQFIAVLEGKGTRNPLDRPYAGRRMSAVDQPC